MKYFTLITLIITGASLVACTSSDRQPDAKLPSQNTIAPQVTSDAAPKLIDSYIAHINDKDKVDNKGARLTNAKDIILQDRKNYYDFNLRDKLDTPSKVFASKENRWGEGKPISDMKWEPINSRNPAKGYHWNIRQGVEYEIIQGNPDLKIQIYNDGNIHIDPMNRY